MKIAIFNDRKIPMHLKIQTPLGVSRMDQMEYRKLERATIQTVDIEIPKGTIPYFKIWETGEVFLSFMETPNEG
jgi:hypothetical protein